MHGMHGLVSGQAKGCAADQHALHTCEAPQPSARVAASADTRCLLMGIARCLMKRVTAVEGKLLHTHASTSGVRIGALQDVRVPLKLTAIRVL